MLLSIATMIQSRHGAFIWWPFWVDRYRTLDEVFDALRRDGCIKGWKIESVRNPDGSISETGRVETIVGRELIGTVTELHVPLAPAERAARFERAPALSS